MKAQNLAPLNRLILAILHLFFFFILHPSLTSIRITKQEQKSKLSVQLLWVQAHKE